MTQKNSKSVSPQAKNEVHPLADDTDENGPVIDDGQKDLRSNGAVLRLQLGSGTRIALSAICFFLVVSFITFAIAEPEKINQLDVFIIVSIIAGLSICLTVILTALLVSTGVFKTQGVALSGSGAVFASIFLLLLTPTVTVHFQKLTDVQNQYQEVQRDYQDSLQQLARIQREFAEMRSGRIASSLLRNVEFMVLCPDESPMQSYIAIGGELVESNDQQDRFLTLNGFTRDHPPRLEMDDDVTRISLRGSTRENAGDLMTVRISADGTAIPGIEVLLHNGLSELCSRAPISDHRSAQITNATLEGDVLEQEFRSLVER